MHAPAGPDKLFRGRFGQSCRPCRVNFAASRSFAFAAMPITVNGAPFDAPEACTVTDLLRAMGLEGQRCAVEVNGEIVSRTGWAACAVVAGDRVEVVRAIGGG